MEKQILNFTVNEQILVCENPIKISTNKVNYIQAQFDLGQNWQGYDSIRAIWFNDFQTISTVLDSLGNCVVPFEVMKRKGCVKVNLVGSISEDDVLTDRLTSYPVVAVIVDCTAQITGANTQPITPSEFEQFAQRVHEDAERAEQGASEAEASAQNASDSATSASNSAESAHDDKIAIEEAIAEVIQQIEDFEQVQVVVNTLPPSSQATSDFTDGVLTLGIPQGVKGDTGNGIQSIAKVSTSGLVDTYRITYTDGQTTTFTVTNGAKGDTGNGISSIEKTSTVGLVDTYTITYTGGTTTTFTVTNGEKGDKGDTGEVSLSELEDATIVQTLSDTEPYNFRRTNNGNGAGHREYDEIVGASVGWNQLVGSNHVRNEGIATYNSADNSFAINGTATNEYIWLDYFTPIANHKYLFTYSATSILAYMSVDGGATRVTNNSILSPTTTSNAYMGYKGTAGTSYNETLRVNIIDLTLALGTQIADYVYSLEQSTAGSGVTWLKTHFPKLFDNGYQPFDAGSIKSVSGLTAHEMTGKNLFNPSVVTQSCRVDNSNKVVSSSAYNTYAIKVPKNTDIAFSKVGIVGSIIGLSNKLPSVGDDILFVRTVTNVLSHSFNSGNYGYVLLSWSASDALTDVQIEIGATATEIVPFIKHTYPLDSSVTLRGQYKLDANNQLYADGDVWKSSGEIDRTWSEVEDLGSLNWSAVSMSNNRTAYYTSHASWNDKPYVNANNPTPCIIGNGKYTAIAQGASTWSVGSMVFTDASGTLPPKSLGVITNSGDFASADAFKISLNSVHLAYELATPTTETATPYTSPQWCDSHGTEEYVGSELPCGHNTTYPMSLVDTMPTTNGTFEPRVTVTNGVRTVTWVSV